MDVFFCCVYVHVCHILRLFIHNSRKTITFRAATVCNCVATYLHMSHMCLYVCQDAYLVHREVSVVEVARASLEADFSHAVVNQKEISEL